MYIYIYSSLHIYMYIQKERQRGNHQFPLLLMLKGIHSFPVGLLSEPAYKLRHEAAEEEEQRSGDGPGTFTTPIPIGR